MKKMLFSRVGIAGIILLGSFVITLGVFVSVQAPSSLASSVQWTQETGAGESVPACASGGMSTSCSAGQGALTVNFYDLHGGSASVFADFWGGPLIWTGGEGTITLTGLDSNRTYCAGANDPFGGQYGPVCQQTPPCVPPPPTCFPDPSSVSTRQNTTAIGNGGSGSYTWSGGELPSPTGSGPTFTTNYTTSGSKVISVSGGGSNTCGVTVYQPTLVISPSPVPPVQIGNTVPLNAIYDADGPAGPSGNVTVTATAVWSSDSPAIATVDAGGVVTGVSDGSTAIRAAYTDSFGNALSATADITVTPLPALSISLGASPASPGTAPFSTTLTADITSYTGNPSDAINYTFWWNCNDPRTSVSEVQAVCGDPNLAANGFKIDGTLNDRQSAPLHIYSQGSYTAKVIVERDGAEAKEVRIPIVANWPAIGGSCAPSTLSAGIGDLITWNAIGTGGDGTYTFDWGGSGNWNGGGALTCSGEPSSGCAINPGSYSDTGTKNASVTIRSASMPPYTATCLSVNISENIISFTATPVVPYGGKATLQWATLGYLDGQCSINQGIGIANPAAGGSRQTPALTTTTTYTFTCDNGGVPESLDATVVVGAPPTFKEVPPK